MATTVINVKTGKRYDIYIGRGSKWGNPFHMYSEKDRENVIEKYRKYLKSKPDLIAAAKIELKNKILGCYCAPKSCHGDILAAIADNKLNASDL